MLHYIQLVRAGLFTPVSLWKLWCAKRKHKKNICFLLKFAADRYGDRFALTDGEEPYSFRELYLFVLRLSPVIRDAINPGPKTTVLLHCDNSPDHVLAFYALQNLGITVIMVNNKIHRNELLKIIDRQPHSCYLFSTDARLSDLPGWYNIHDLVQQAKNNNAGTIYSTKAAKLVFSTSGTTGDPKLVEKKQGEFYWLRSFGDLLAKTKIHKRKAVYISIPISHGFGYTAMLFALVLGKKTLVLSNKDGQDLAKLANKEHTDLLVGVPASLNHLTDLFQNTRHPFQSIISGGAALNDSIFRSIVSVFGTNIFSIYGSTEASVSFIAGFKELSLHSNALGTPFKGIEYQLEELPSGGSELLLRSKLSNVPARTAWWHTGDLVEALPDGSLVWCGRKDSMIIKNGVNIYPDEIVQQLLFDPSIEDAMVTSQKDEIKGQLILAFVKIKTGQRFNDKSIKQRLKQSLSGIKIPDRIIETKEFQFTATGKKMLPADPGKPY